MPTLRDAAQEYREKGYHPIPCQQRGKRPLVPWRDYQHRQPTEMDVEGWWGSLFPQANIGLVMGRDTFVVDVDDVSAAEAAGFSVPPGIPVSETGKGLHCYFRGTMPDRVRALPGVDIRGVGYVLAPPSIHPNGKPYAWWRPLPRVSDLQPCPAATRAKLLGGGVLQNTPKDAAWVLEALGPVSEGARDATCAKLAGYLWRKELPEGVIRSLLTLWAKGCTPPFPQAEVDKTVASIARRDGGPQIPLLSQLWTVKDLYKQASDAHQWIVQDYLPAGALILLASEEKTGKSTFVYSLASKVAQGQPFLGRRVTKTGVLMLAVEEHATDVKLRAQRFGLTESDRMAFYVGDLKTTPETYGELKDIILGHGFGLVILDTLGHHVANVLESENDNLGVLRAIKPWLNLARETGAAIVLLHHKGKNSYTAYRGASALGGIVDLILSMRDGGDSKRVINARGRYSEVPKEEWIDLRGNDYYVL